MQSFKESIIIPYRLYKKCNFSKEKNENDKFSSRNIEEKQNNYIKERMFNQNPYTIYGTSISNHLKPQANYNTNYQMDLTQKSDSKQTISNDEILAHIKVAERPNIRNILIELNNNKVSWNNFGEIIINEKVRHSTSIIDIMRFFSNTVKIKSSQDIPNGANEIFDILQEMKIPLIWMRNTPEKVQQKEYAILSEEKDRLITRPYPPYFYDDTLINNEPYNMYAEYDEYDKDDNSQQDTLAFMTPPELKSTPKKEPKSDDTGILPGLKQKYEFGATPPGFSNIFGVLPSGISKTDKTPINKTPTFSKPFETPFPSTPSKPSGAPFPSTPGMSDKLKEKYISTPGMSDILKEKYGDILKEKYNAKKAKIDKEIKKQLALSKIAEKSTVKTPLSITSSRGRHLRPSLKRREMMEVNWDNTLKTK